MMVAGRKEDGEVEGYKMDVTELSKSKEKLSFVLKDGVSSFANALRRIMIDEVPTMAIEDVEFRKNSSILYDEVIAHRLGLMPLKTDLKSYNLPEECKCKGEGCARCQNKMVLSSKANGFVYASDMKSKDPKIVPVYPNTPLVKLLKNQEVDLEATAVLGIGKKHAKWSPGLVFFKHPVDIKINHSKIKESEIIASSCPCKIFEVKGGKLSIVSKNLANCHLCDACVEASGEAVELNPDTNSFIFTVESWGQLKPKDMVKKAIDVFDSKVDEFLEKVKSL
ncbi:DNA-directed RNA polymerase subunit D [Candidatus Woesearchaeota archaeon]|nr:DNA-directed RNA polymerase subunit D [Candidatus Woesearchaeota archaeon]